MAYEERPVRPEIKHNVIMEGRRRLAISGVTDVESFNEEEIIMYTSGGDMTIQGSEMHITKLNLDSGDINIEGQIDGIRYEAVQMQKGGFFTRLFK